jgi:hypothetical protein
MPSVPLDFLGKVKVLAGGRILGVPGKVGLATGAMRVVKTVEGTIIGHDERSWQQ